MKKVVLLGDSIRMDYGRYVKKSFEQAGTAQVFYPEENCRFSGYVLRNLGPWKVKMACGSDVHLIHWNVGLWDCLHMLDDRSHTDIAVYQDNLERIWTVLKKLYPNAAQVFALTTAVLEDQYRVYKRCNREIEEYNAAAVQVLEPLGVQINDLYSITRDIPEGCRSDMTHFDTKEGARLLANQVINCIEHALDIRAQSLDYDTLFEKQTEIIGI